MRLEKEEKKKGEREDEMPGVSQAASSQQTQSRTQRKKGKMP